MKVRLFKPSVGQDELNAVAGAIDRAWLGLGMKVAEFERRWAEYIGSPHAVGVNSGTAALHLAVTACGLPKGSKVLVPAMTFVSTAAAVLYNGLEPVFVDCDSETMGLDLDDAERKVTDDCGAIMVVHMYGHPAPMDRVMAFAARHGLKVIEDCAHCTGGSYQGQKLGTFGDFGCFSFEEKKCMTSGDGGMLVFKDGAHAEPLKAMRWVGIDKDTWKRNEAYTDVRLEARHWYYEIALLGYKYNMNDLAASIGLVQLDKLDAMNAARTRGIRRYMDGLSSASRVRPIIPFITDGSAAYWIFGLRTGDRDDLMRYLKGHEISTGLHYTPLTRHPLMAPYASPVPNCDAVYEQIMTLPLFADITDEEIDYVIAHVLAWDEVGAQ